MWLPICCSGLSTNSSSTAESIPVTCPITPHLFLSNSHLNTLLKHTMPFRLIAMPELCGSSIFQVCICYLWVSLWTHWPSALHVAESRCSSQQHREESNDSQKKLREFVSVAHIFILPFENSTCGEILLGIFGLATWSPCSFELITQIVIEFLEVLHPFPGDGIVDLNHHSWLIHWGI